MKKMLLTAAGVLMISLGVMAQAKRTTDSDVKGGNFIIKGGLSLANISVTTNGRVNDANALKTFHAGFAIDLPVCEYFSVQPGLMYTGKGAKTQYGKEGDPFYYKASSNPMYLEIPVNFVGKLPLTQTSSFYLGGGPYAAMGITGKNKVDTYTLGVARYSSNDIVFSNDDPTTAQEENYGYGKIKRFDYGLNAVAGLEFSRIIIGASYGHGLVKINSGTDNTANDKGKYRTWNFSLGLKL